jgi:alpha-D-ribose 1-methylphosphonate 5-triphosphate synthase subunit PhnI
MYVAVKGGEKAIENSHKLLTEKRRGSRAVPDLSLQQIQEQLYLAVERVMAEGSLYDRELAALAVKQACGDLLEAIFLLRAYRTTLPRFGHTRPLDTSALTAHRRISAIFKDLPGGQILGPTFDYTHRLLDFSLAGENGEEIQEEPTGSSPTQQEDMPRVADMLGKEGLIQVDLPDASRSNSPRAATPASKTWPAGMRGFCWAWPIPPSEGLGKTTPLWGKSGRGRSRWR